jgi:GNAT superfamily N-acetyltransferase
MPNVTIRQAVVDDVPLILDFIIKKAGFDGAPQAVRATPERLRQTLFADPPMAHILIAEIEGRPVGFASYFLTYSTFLARPGFWLDDLFVDDEMRGRGVGTALLADLARLAQSRGCERIEWTAAAANRRGLDFYRRHGAVVREATRLCRLEAEAIDRLVRATEGESPT